MHDGKNSCALEVLSFDILIIPEKLRDSGILIKDRLNDFGVDQSIELACDKHFFHALFRRYARERQIGGRRKLDFFFVLFEPLNLPMRNLVLVFAGSPVPRDWPSRKSFAARPCVR